MKIKTFSIFLIPLFFLLFLFSCSNDDGQEPITLSPHENSSLEVWVREKVDTGLLNLEGAEISLYESELARKNDYKPLKGATDEDGLHTFISLAKSEYWIAVRYGGTTKWIFDEAPFDTPGHPVLLNKLEVVFND